MFKRRYSSISRFICTIDKRKIGFSWKKMCVEKICCRRRSNLCRLELISHLERECDVKLTSIKARNSFNLTLRMFSGKDNFERKRFVELRARAWRVDTTRTNRRIRRQVRSLGCSELRKPRKESNCLCRLSIGRPWSDRKDCIEPRSARRSGSIVWVCRGDVAEPDRIMFGRHSLTEWSQRRSSENVTKEREKERPSIVKLCFVPPKDHLLVFPQVDGRLEPSFGCPSFFVDQIVDQSREVNLVRTINSFGRFDKNIGEFDTGRQNHVHRTILVPDVLVCKEYVRFADDRPTR